MNFNKMMKQLQRTQSELQEKLAAMRVEGSAGGGMVRAELSGNRELLAIHIEREAVDPDDVDMLQDLVVAAVNDANRKVEEALQAELGGLAGSLGIPGLF